MGAPTAGLQSSQSSAPAGKGASASPSSQPMGKGGASMSATSGQPTIGQPNTNSNTGMAMANPSMVAPNDGSTNGNPYPNTVGGLGSVAGGQNGQPMTNNAMGKSGGSNQSMGKGSGSGKGSSAGNTVEQGGGFNPNMQIEDTYHPTVGPTNQTFYK